MNTKVLSKAETIRILNDRLRKTFVGGRIMMTAAVAEMEPAKKARLLGAVRAYDDFGKDNDPHHEHDMAFFEFEREQYYFKVDYYDLKCEYGSENPADPTVTTRVLTIGHASDY